MGVLLTDGGIPKIKSSAMCPTLLLAARDDAGRVSTPPLPSAPLRDSGKPPQASPPTPPYAPPSRRQAPNWSWGSTGLVATAVAEAVAAARFCPGVPDGETEDAAVVDIIPCTTDLRAWPGVVTPRGSIAAAAAASAASNGAEE